MTIKLTVDNQDIVMPVDATISIEKNSPVLNEEVGSFSYPFPVPTEENRAVLGYPGRLERASNIPVKSFRLEENGVQILSGEMEIDNVTSAETGMILQSGNSEFSKRMKDKMLGEIDYGHESWPSGPVPVATKLAYWDTRNTVSNGKYVVAPFVTPFVVAEIGVITANAQKKVSGNSTLAGDGDFAFKYFCLQFLISFVYRTIFLKSGYVIKEDQFIESEFNKAILFGNLLQLGDSYDSFGVPSFLEYSSLMPEVKILDFLQRISGLFCLSFDINETKKEVYVRFKKGIFSNESLSSLKITELTGWDHTEKRAVKGFSLRLGSQDSELDTEYDYKIGNSGLYLLPAPTPEGATYRLTSLDRDYRVIKNDAGALEWKEIGRLKEYREGNGENVIDIDVNIPAQQKNKYFLVADEYECPTKQEASYPGNSRIKTTSELSVCLYHGRKTFSECLVPYLSFDRYSMTGGTIIDTGLSLKPSYLYKNGYKEFLNWQTYRARECTKYIELTLSEAVALEWGKRYMISGMPILLNQVSFELPYRGIVKINGFTA